MTVTTPPTSNRAARAPEPAPSSQSELRPWERSWLYRAPGETRTLLWVAGLHLAVPVGLLLLPFPGWWVIAVAAIFFALGGLGTTVAYHRALTHRAVTLSPLVEQPLVFLAIFNGSGNPLTWVANHRYHHANADTERDISSPRHGFWWSHLRWLWQCEQASPADFCADLVRRGFQRWGRWQAPILALSLLGGLVLWPFVGWQMALAACLWLGPIRLLLALHAQCTVNSLCHMGPLTPEHGSGKNVWWITPLHLGQGENWHANHHQVQNDPRLGRTWWQVDMGWWTIVLLGKCGLAEKIRVQAAPRRGRSGAAGAERERRGSTARRRTLGR